MVTLSNWIGPKMCVCVYLSSFMSPADPDDALGDGSNHMASGSGRGGLLSPTTALEVQAALCRVYLTPKKKIPCRFLEFVKVINLLTCISQLIHTEFGNYCCLQGQRGKRSYFVPEVVEMFLLLTQRT